MHTSHLLFLSLLAAPVLAQDQDTGTSYLFRVDAPTAGQRLLLVQQFDVPSACCGAVAQSGPLEVIVQPDQLALFQSLAPAAVFVRRGQPFRDILQAVRASGLDVPDPLYYTVAEIEQAIDAAVAAHPAIATKVEITALPGGVRTVQNRPIYALKVSDNVAVDEDEPAILIAAQHHARELNSPHMVIGAMNRVLAAYATDPALQGVVNGYEVYFVPMVNPDGVEHVWTVDDFWRKNRRPNGGTSYGVDCNRNYPFLWGMCGSSTSTTSETYRGPSAGSEPEVVTMRNLVARLRPEIYLDFHSSGRDVLDTYAPCATVNNTLNNLIVNYRQDIRLRMLAGTPPQPFNFRDPSGSGEAPEDHWASGGTLSYLIEIGTAFQPSFNGETVAEEAAVWPGIQRAITAWRPAVRGHLRTIQGLPLLGSVTYTPNMFSHGEALKSRARDGRYGMWLPIGTWNVTWSATGYQSRTRSVTVTQYDQTQTIDIELEPNWTPSTIVKAGSGQIGTTVTFTYTSPGDAGLLCLFGWSLGTTPGTSLGGGRVLPLNPDFLLEAALGGNPFLTPTWVVLDGNHQAQSFLHIPNLPWVAGFTTWVTGITSDPSYSRLIKKWSTPVSVTPLP